MQKEIKKAIESAEQEIQEKEIANLKSIIKDLLEKKVSKEKDKREIEKEIGVIKQTIDDFKAGRLDKIKELQEKDTVARDILPFKIIIINQPVITQPWKWVYQVQPNYMGSNFQTITTASVIGTNAIYTGDLNTLAVNTGGLSGQNYATFAGGSYNVQSSNGGNSIINL